MGKSPRARGGGETRTPPALACSSESGGLGRATCGFAEHRVSAPARCCPRFTIRLRTQRGPTEGPVPSGRGRLRRSGPPRPGTDRPAGHGKADAGVEENSRLLGCDLWSRPWPTPTSKNARGGRPLRRAAWGNPGCWPARAQPPWSLLPNDIRSGCLGAETGTLRVIGAPKDRRRIDVSLAAGKAVQLQAYQAQPGERCTMDYVAEPLKRPNQPMADS